MTIIRSLVVGLALTALLNLAAIKQARAWVVGENVTVTQFIFYEGSTYGAVIQLSNGTFCFTNPEEKTLISTLLSLHLTGKSANFHCHDAASSINGVSAHKLHRVGINSI